MNEVERKLVKRVVESLKSPDPSQRVDTQTRKELERLVDRLKRQAEKEAGRDTAVFP